MLAIDNYDNALIAGTAFLLLAGTIVVVIGLLLRSARDPEAPPVEVNRHPRRRWIVAAGFALIGIGSTLLVAGSFHEISTDASSSTVSSTTKAQPSSPKIAPRPDPLAALNIGDCVTMKPPKVFHSGTMTTTFPTEPPIPGDCSSSTTNYRLVQKMPSNEPCTDNQVWTQFSKSKDGVVTVPTLCFVFDWRAGNCYDKTNLQEPLQVDCSTTGSNIVHVSAVFTDTLSDDNCPRNENGFQSTTWDTRRLVVCMLNPPN